MYTNKIDYVPVFGRIEPGKKGEIIAGAGVFIYFKYGIDRSAYFDMRKLWNLLNEYMDAVNPNRPSIQDTLSRMLSGQKVVMGKKGKVVLALEFVTGGNAETYYYAHLKLVYEVREEGIYMHPADLSRHSPPLIWLKFRTEIVEQSEYAASAFIKYFKEYSW